MKFFRVHSEGIFCLPTSYFINSTERHAQHLSALINLIFIKTKTTMVFKRFIALGISGQLSKYGEIWRDLTDHFNSQRPSDAYLRWLPNHH